MAPLLEPSIANTPSSIAAAIAASSSPIAADIVWRCSSLLKTVAFRETFQPSSCSRRRKHDLDPLKYRKLFPFPSFLQVRDRVSTYALFVNNKIASQVVAKTPVR
jgi:hypothetical protein